MLFEKITLENFASYKNRNEIELRPENPEKPIVLIGGENGCGKTTLLDALQLVLFGPLAQCSNRGRQTYKNYLKKCINNSTDPEYGSVLELSFQFNVERSVRTFKIRRAWSMTKGKINERFSVFNIENKTETYDKVLSDNWLDYIESFFPSKIAPFFLFDGEKIEQLADFEKSGPIIHAAISSLLGLDHIDRLASDLITLEKRHHKTFASDNENKVIDEIENEIEKTKQQIQSLERKIANCNNQLDLQKKKIEENEITYRLLGGNLFDRRAELEVRHEKSKEVLNQHEEELRLLASGCAPLLLVQDLLQEIQEDAKLEKQSQRAFFISENLAKRDLKLLEVINTLGIDRHASNQINSFLEKDRQSFDEMAKHPIYLDLSQDSFEKLNNLLSSEAPRLKNELPGRIEKINEATTELDNSERMLSSIPEEATLAKIINVRETLKKNQRNTLNLRSMTEEELRKARYALERNQQILQKNLQNISEANLRDKNARRVLDYSQKTRETLSKLKERVLNNHLRRVENLILESFNQLLRKIALIQRLKINPKTFCLHLYNSTGQEITPDRLSAGERQLLATAILWGICKAAGKPLPTIIDTPLGRLDSSHRSNLISHYFPNASHQVILLSTDEEIVGKHLECLQPYISHKLLLSHSISEGETKTIPGYFTEKLGKVA